MLGGRCIVRRLLVRKLPNGSSAVRSHFMLTKSIITHIARPAKEIARYIPRFDATRQFSICQQASLHSPPSSVTIN